MNNVIFSFSKPASQSTVVGNHLALFIAETLDLPLIWDKRIELCEPDILFIVNGAFAFCDCLESLAYAIEAAQRVVWIQNDYTIKPPVTTPGAESPFRKAFQLRHLAGKPKTDYWTTVRRNRKLSKLSQYINWNQMTALKEPLEPTANAIEKLYYYGAYRVQRTVSFDRYFTSPQIRTRVSSTSKKFAERYPNVELVKGLPRELFYRTLNRQGLGLYIEDKRSHNEYHSPANRFYEMLSAGLPMVFDYETGAMLYKEGFDVSDYIIPPGCPSERVLHTMMKERVDIAREQQERWWDDFKRQLRTTMRAQYLILVRKHDDTKA